MLDASTYLAYYLCFWLGFEHASDARATFWSATVPFEEVPSISTAFAILLASSAADFILRSGTNVTNVCAVQSTAPDSTDDEPAGIWPKAPITTSI